MDKPLAERAEEALHTVIDAIIAGHDIGKYGRDYSAIVDSLHRMSRLERDLSTSNRATQLVGMTRKDMLDELAALAEHARQKQTALDAVPEVHNPL